MTMQVCCYQCFWIGNANPSPKRRRVACPKCRSQFLVCNENEVFQYHNGTEIKTLDPLSALASLAHVEGFVINQHWHDAIAGDFEAKSILAKAIRQVMRLSNWEYENPTGFCDHDCYRLSVAFLKHFQSRVHHTESKPNQLTSPVSQPVQNLIALPPAPPSPPPPPEKSCVVIDQNGNVNVTCIYVTDIPVLIRELKLTKKEVKTEIRRLKLELRSVNSQYRRRNAATGPSIPYMHRGKSDPFRVVQFLFKLGSGLSFAIDHEQIENQLKRLEITEINIDKAILAIQRRSS